MDGCLRCTEGGWDRDLQLEGSARAKADKLGWVCGDSRESRVVVARGQEVRSSGDARRGSQEWGQA